MSILKTMNISLLVKKWRFNTSCDICQGEGAGGGAPLPRQEVFAIFWWKWCNLVQCWDIFLHYNMNIFTLLHEDSILHRGRVREGVSPARNRKNCQFWVKMVQSGAILRQKETNVFVDLQYFFSYSFDVNIFFNFLSTECR